MKGNIWHTQHPWKTSYFDVRETKKIVISNIVGKREIDRK